MNINICAQGKMGNLLSGQQFGSTGSLASASDTDQVCIFHCQVHQKYRKRQIKFDFVCEKKFLS